MPQSAISALSFPGRAFPLPPVEAGAALIHASTLPISVIVPAKNEARNLAVCLQSLRNFGEVLVVDSQSSDATVEIARSWEAHVVQFHYRGGWPKKRQWALDNLPLRYEWVLLLDADEAVTPVLEEEIRGTLANPQADGYYIGLDMFFLGKRLRHCGATFYKLSLFKHGTGRFECRTVNQDASMCDMEVHEHVVVSGATLRLNNRLLHRNVDTLSRYIRKHDEYSNWEAQAWSDTESAGDAALRPALFGTQAQSRRWLKKYFLHWPGSPFLLFVYRYLFRGGFLDGVPGLIYCAFQAIQLFHVKAKLYEKRVVSGLTASSESKPERPAHVRD